MNNFKCSTCRVCPSGQQFKPFTFIYITVQDTFAKDYRAHILRRMEEIPPNELNIFPTHHISCPQGMWRPKAAIHFLHTSMVEELGPLTGTFLAGPSVTAGERQLELHLGWVQCWSHQDSLEFRKRRAGNNGINIEFTECLFVPSVQVERKGESIDESENSFDAPSASDFSWPPAVVLQLEQMHSVPPNVSLQQREFPQFPGGCCALMAFRAALLGSSKWAQLGPSALRGLGLHSKAWISPKCLSRTHLKRKKSKQCWATRCMLEAEAGLVDLGSRVCSWSAASRNTNSTVRQHFGNCEAMWKIYKRKEKCFPKKRMEH
ncbi:hypothetical protein DV515_00005440 [Chloebia gouldiae]|uniref:Uncharacterized protein n=1 Tax=Chloebia gouldiae TaxID=44316 RepID=A0A3L8SP26_CHLGU|nr:hypothetical protein DV515_00005440 [Chloebia gouldiae]